MIPTWLQEILSPSRFIPHGHCYLWEPGLVWLHILSDAFIAISYFSIPVMLLYFIRKREDVPFRNVFVLFSLFIITCGTTHLMAIWTLWHPAYWLSGVVKAVTAVVSAYTALTLLPVIPVALALPSAEELRFRSLFESAPDFIYVLSEQGLIRQINPEVTKSSGYVATEMIGQPLTTFLSEDTQAVCQSEFAYLLADGSHRQEMEFICKDGRVLMMDCSCTVVKNDKGENCILVLQRDITQRQKNERERVELLATLQESERRWQSFLDNVQLLVLGLDATGQIEYANPCFINQMSCSKDSIMGKNWFESFVPEPQWERGQAAFASILNGEKHQNYQGSFVTCAGDERIISWNTTLLKDTKGHSAGTLSIGEDVTERHAVDRMKNEFISVVSHELRTPLTAIHGALDLLATGLIDPQSERGQHVFGLAVENSDRLVKLVNDILELERLESGKIKLHKTSISTKELTRRISELLELVAERAGIKLEIAQTDLLLSADCDRLIQVLTNLVGNAIKFSDAPATIWLEVEAVKIDTGPAVKFVVADEGRGIPKSKIDNIFERFHQVDASDSRSKGGTGLGLAICRSIVQQHGGDIWVESTLDEGSRFIFTIPAG